MSSIVFLSAQEAEDIALRGECGRFGGGFLGGTASQDWELTPSGLAPRTAKAVQLANKGRVDLLICLGASRPVAEAIGRDGDLFPQGKGYLEQIDDLYLFLRGSPSWKVKQVRDLLEKWDARGLAEALWGLPHPLVWDEEEGYVPVVDPRQVEYALEAYHRSN